MVRHYEGSAVLAHALERSFSALLVPLFFLGLMCICMAGIIYYVEGVRRTPHAAPAPESAGCGAEGRGGAGREGRGERRGGRGARAEGARRRRPGTARCVLRAVCGAQSPHVPPVALRRCCTRTKTSTTSSRRRGSSS